MLKALPLVHFWSDCCWKSKIMMTSVRTMSKMLVWSAQNRCIAKFTLKITTKFAIFYRLLFGKVCPENSREISHFFREFICKIPRNLTFSSATCQKPWIHLTAIITVFWSLSEFWDVFTHSVRTGFTGLFFQQVK